jgi:sugar-phosphatase
MRAAIFDLDGLLIDSEPLWRRTEVALFGTVGLTLTEAQCAETAGLRIDEVVALRHRQQPWASPTVEVLTEQIVARMEASLRAAVPAKAGVAHALDVCSAHGLRLAVASSSPERLIHAALAGLGVSDRFEVVRSAEREAHGKPHPAVFLRAAERLGVDAVDCVVFEDSLNGLVAAKAARMRCIAVPEHHDARFALADAVLPSLEALDAPLLRALGV